jgi:hypothetical protein
MLRGGVVVPNATCFFSLGRAWEEVVWLEGDPADSRRREIALAPRRTGEEFEPETSGLHWRRALRARAAPRRAP